VEADLFQKWSLPEESAAGTLSFGIDSPAEPETPVWRTDLPADPQQAALVLSAGEQDALKLNATLSLLEQNEPALARLAPADEGGLLSFGVMDYLTGTELPEPLAKILRLVSGLAWVETSIEGRWVARSTAGWGGELRTFWSPWIVPPQMALHRRSLESAVTSRLAMLRLALLAARTAARISALAAAPLTAVLALPSAWKAIQSALADIEKLRQAG
jgi:hypothetical protein